MNNHPFSQKDLFDLKETPVCEAANQHRRHAVILQQPAQRQRFLPSAFLHPRDANRRYRRNPTPCVAGFDQDLQIRNPSPHLLC